VSGGNGKHVCRATEEKAFYGGHDHQLPDGSLSRKKFSEAFT